MTIDDIRMMAMNRRQMKREQKRLEEIEFSRQKPEENGSGNDGDHTREKENNVIAEAK